MQFVAIGIEGLPGKWKLEGMTLSQDQPLCFSWLSSSSGTFLSLFSILLCNFLFNAFPSRLCFRSTSPHTLYFLLSFPSLSFQWILLNPLNPMAWIIINQRAQGQRARSSNPQMKWKELLGLHSPNAAKKGESQGLSLCIKTILSLISCTRFAYMVEFQVSQKYHWNLLVNILPLLTLNVLI